MSTRDDLMEPAAQDVLRELLGDEEVAAQHAKVLAERETLLRLLSEKSGGRLTALGAAGAAADDHPLVQEVIGQAQALGHEVDETHVGWWLDNDGVALSTLVVE